MPSREIFGNIPFGEIVYVLGLIVLGILLYAFWRRTRLWRLGRPENRLGSLSRRIRASFASIIDLLFHRKMLGVVEGLGRRRFSLQDLNPKEFYPGIVHLFIFAGFIVFALSSAVDAISHYGGDFLKGTSYLVSSLVIDIFGLLVIAGVLLAMYRRYVQKPSRLDNKSEDLIALLLILIVVVSGFVVEGFRIAATELKTNPDWAVWSPGGFILAISFSGMSQETLLAWHRFTWWAHMVISMGAMAYVALYWNRLWHIVISMMNVFLRNLEPRGALAPIDLEKAESFGAAKIEDFTWKQLLDLDACTRCGRCQDSCPAHLSGKPLSPKKVVQDLKGAWLERAKGVESQRPMIGGVVLEDEIWNCTTCYACHEACPVAIEPMTKIIEMRRNLVLEKASIPETGEGALKSLEARGHPWRGTTLTRTDWMKGLEVKTLVDDKNIDVLFWVGCTSALEERSTKVAQSIARVLKLGGVNFGILGAEEACCGDPARRLGNEYLFQTLAQANIELFKNYGIKKIVTGCPHCFNTLKYEYPQFGGNFEVVHHSQFIAGLVRSGKLKASASIPDVVTYHDSCYLGRYNDIYDSPRQVLKGLGVKLKEMPKNRERGFCCGAGGGHLWLEEQKKGERINHMRTEQALATGVKVIATACPYCLQMFEDGIKAKASEESVKVRDIAEIVAESASK